MTFAERVKSSGAKVAVIDIERLPGAARVWDQKTRFIPVSQWTQLPSLLCFSSQWVGQKQIEFHAAWDDYDAMIQRAHEIYDTADAIVGFNSRRFDNAHFRGAWVVANMTPPSPWKDIDLYTVAGQNFGFESRSLNHLCHKLGLPTKETHYDAVVAEKAMAGDETAQRKMRRYNRHDVKITLAAYQRMLPWIHNHPALYLMGQDRPLCNKCADGGDLEVKGTYLANQIRYQQYQCRICGGWVRGVRHSRAALSHGIK